MLPGYLGAGLRWASRRLGSDMSIGLAGDTPSDAFNGDDSMTDATMFGQVLTPPTVNLTTGTTFPVQLGKNGDLLTSGMHGNYSAATRAGGVFLGSTLAAGIAVPFNATTLSSKFTLWNPASSGVDVELIELGMGFDSATVIVNSIAMGFMPNLTTGSGIPTSLTAAAGGTMSTFVGNGSTPKAGVYSAATLTNTAVLGPLLMLFTASATAITSAESLTYRFDGKIWLPPDSLCALVTTVTAGQTAGPVSIVWAEYVH